MVASFRYVFSGSVADVGASDGGSSAVSARPPNEQFAKLVVTFVVATGLVASGVFAASGRRSVRDRAHVVGGVVERSPVGSVVLAPPFCLRCLAGSVGCSVAKTVVAVCNERSSASPLAAKRASLAAIRRTFTPF